MENKKGKKEIKIKTNKSLIKRSYLHFLWIVVLVGFIISLGMIPSDNSIYSRLLISAMFIGVFLLFGVWVLFWLKQCKTKKQRKIFWIVLAIMSPFLLWGVLVGGLLGIIGIFIFLFLPVFVVLPLLVYILRQEWSKFFISLVIIIIVLTLAFIIGSKFQNTDKQIESRYNFCTSHYNEEEAVWNDETNVCEVTIKGKIRQRFVGSYERSLPVEGQPVELSVQYDEPSQKYFLEGDFSNNEDSGRVIMQLSHRITILEERGKSSVFLVPYNIDYKSGKDSSHVGVFYFDGGLNIKHIETLELSDAKSVEEVQAEPLDSEKRKYKVTVSYVQEPDNLRKRVFTLTLKG